jgi:CRISPR-associated protein Cmr2
MNCVKEDKNMPKLSDFHARYSLLSKPDHVQQEAIDFLTGKEKLPPKSWQELAEVTDPSARLSLLTQALLTYKDYARVGRRRDAGLLEALGMLEQHYIKQYDDFLIPLCINPAVPDISIFPEGSWAISFKFKLKKPYISKDDTDFYIIDNPIRKEWVFKLPYIAASQWKGALRAAMVKKLVEISDENECAKRRFELTLLFGDEKGEAFGENNEILPSHSGNLYFYPTYFKQIGIEVINPHDRETGVGTQPIYFESVPSGEKGEFLLLYVPLYCKREVDQETHYLRFVIEGIKAMMTQYGFGAKTSSGFGMAENNIEHGGFVLNKKKIDAPFNNKEPKNDIPEEYVKYLKEDGTAKKELCASDGKLLSTTDYAQPGAKKEMGLKKFKDFKRWYNDYIEKKKSIQHKNFADDLYHLEFNDFDQLLKQADILLQNIKGSEGSNC